MVDVASLGLQQSLFIMAQRRHLDELGARVGTPVLYLKAAWADPVLYGGGGLRPGCDLDILVRPARFAAFAEALLAQGFRRFREPWHMASQRLIGKAWLYLPPPTADLVAVDLHRGVADKPWFQVPADELLDRAVAYASVDGPILSLAPEDQIVYAATHYANHRYEMKHHHLNDVVLLLKKYPVNWDLVWLRAGRAQAMLPIMLLAAALRHRGVVVPPAPANDAWLRWRSRMLRACFPSVETLSRQTRRREVATLMPLLSDSAWALPRYALRAALVRTLDGGEELLARVQQRLAHQG